MRLTRALRRYFVAGVLTLIPFAVTYWIFRFLFEIFDGLLGPVVDRVLHRHVPGAGIAFSLLLVVVCGALVSNMAGKKALAYVARFLENIPLVKTVYSAARQMVTALSPAGRGLRRVVLVEYPRRGIYSIGFVTSRMERGSGAPGGRVAVLIPAALNPTSGVVVLVAEEDLVDPGFTVEEGIRLVVSGGFASPERTNGGAEGA